MKTIIIAILFLGILSTGCDPVDNYIDTGIVETKHDCSIWEYLHTDSYDWDSVIVMIERANMVDVFKNEENITFFGLTNHTIRRYLLDNDYMGIGNVSMNDLSPFFCEELLKKHIIRGKYMKKDVAFRIPDISGQIIGGTDLTTMGGNVVKAYREKENYAGVAFAGAEVLHLYSLTAGKPVPLASPDIECNNGVVHSLNYNYRIGNI